MILRRIAASLCLLFGAVAAWLLPAAADGGRGGVVVVPIHGTVDADMAHLVARAVADAKRSDARAIVLDVDSSGGLVSAATEIRDALLNSPVPVDAYVSRAWSAGALVALSAGRIEMAPAASLGAAQPVPASAKAVAELRGEFAATAAHYRRDATLAAAMVDAAVDAPAYKAPGAILTLTADQARTAGISEATAPSVDAALGRWNLAAAPRASAEYGAAERIARFATSPEVSGILLAIGFLGLLIELQTLHLVAGAAGVGALALFFGTHAYAGFSSGLVGGLALLGVLLILAELHVLPGHGFAGVAGVLTLVAAVLLAFGLPFLVGGLQALALAIVLSALAFALLQRVLPENAFVKRLMFAGAQGADYVAAPDYRRLLGRAGVSVSFLRPAGLASFGETRVDVLSEGDFVPAGTPVRVTRVEGARIFVRPEPPA